VRFATKACSFRSLFSAMLRQLQIILLTILLRTFAASKVSGHRWLRIVIRVTHRSENGKFVMGPALKHKDLLSSQGWSFAKNLVDMKYFEIDD
jgi:hypothetical protein